MSMTDSEHTGVSILVSKDMYVTFMTTGNGIRVLSDLLSGSTHND